MATCALVLVQMKDHTRSSLQVIAHSAPNSGCSLLFLSLSLPSFLHNLPMLFLAAYKPADLIPERCCCTYCCVVTAFTCCFLCLEWVFADPSLAEKKGEGEREEEEEKEKEKERRLHQLIPCNLVT